MPTNLPPQMKIEQEIARTRKRPMPEAKMVELFGKLRKGASASLTFGKLVQVLETLRWKVEPTLGWTPRHYPYSGEETLVTQDTRRYTAERLGELREEMIASEPSSLPDAPSRVGERVVANIGEIKTGYIPTYLYFNHREWVGTEGVAVTSPRGEEAIFLVDHHEIDKGNLTLADDNSAPSDMWRQLLKMGILDDVNAALGTETHVPAEARTRENTGTCPACWGNYKLSKGKLVLHGYQRPGYGFIKGRCFCEGYPPLETDVVGAVDYRELLKGHLEAETEKLAKLESGEVVAVPSRHGNRMIEKGDPLFARALEVLIDRTKHLVKELEADVKLYDKVVEAWHERPMPREGELQRGPGFFVKK